MTLETLTELMGWITLLNIGLLLFSTIMILLLKSTITKIHSRMFDIDATDLSRLYFDYLGRFKMLVIVFNLAPYFALKLIG